MKSPNKICLECGLNYYVKPYLINTSKYCSVKCKNKNNTIKIKNTCLICKEQFEHISSRCNKAKYCSRSCYYKSQHTKGTIKFQCIHCEKEFYGSPSDIGKRKYCSRICTNKSNHKNFNPKFTTVRKAMLSRGLIKKCNRCFYKENPLILGVHHKDRDRNNNDISNLEILCPNCHSLEHLKHIVCHK